MCNTDLFGSDLRASSLWGAHASNANLQFAQLQGADLEYANLNCADMRGAHLQNLEPQLRLSQLSDYVKDMIKDGQIIRTNLKELYSRMSI